MMVEFLYQPHPLRHLLGNPIPFIPFPLSRGRGIVYVREASPLFDSLFHLSPSKEGGRELIKRG